MWISPFIIESLEIGEVNPSITRFIFDEMQRKEINERAIQGRALLGATNTFGGHTRVTFRVTCYCNENQPSCD